MLSSTSSSRLRQSSSRISRDNVGQLNEDSATLYFSYGRYFCFIVSGMDLIADVAKIFGQWLAFHRFKEQRQWSSPPSFPCFSFLHPTFIAALNLGRRFSNGVAFVAFWRLSIFAFRSSFSNGLSITRVALTVFSAKVQFLLFARPPLLTMSACGPAGIPVKKIHFSCLC